MGSKMVANHVAICVAILVVTLASLVSSQCTEESVYIEPIKLCVLGKRLNAECTWDQECAVFDNNTMCDMSRCLCKTNFQYNHLVNRCTFKAIFFTNREAMAADPSYIASINESVIPVFKSKLDVDLDEELGNGGQNETINKKICQTGFIWNESLDKCQQRLIAVKAENILFLFTVMFVFCVLFILILKKREQDFLSQRRTQTLLHNLMALHSYVAHQIELKEYNVAHVNPPPSYQEVFNSNHNLDIEELPSYEEALKLDSFNKMNV